MIETQDLGKQFNGFWAVDGLTLTVRPGEVLALLGENGAGKTTTVRLLTALLFPSRGWARVAGYDVARRSDEVRASIGVLTEQHGLYARMTALEYLDFYGQIYRLDGKTRRARRDALLDYFGLTEMASRRIGEYSKGMRQKLALARALIHDPPVLLLDEPTSAMDPESARLVREEIARLRSSQRTIVICTHNLAEAEALADKIAIIYKGRILVMGTLDELKEQVLGPTEYEVRLSAPWEARGREWPPGVTFIEQQNDLIRLRIANPPQTNPRVVHQLASWGAPLLAFQESPRSLEQVYLKVMAQARPRRKEAIYA